MSWRDRLLEAMTERLAGKDRLGGVYFGEAFELGDRVVVDYSEETESDGYCETCYYEYTVLEYRFNDGTSVRESTTLADLMYEL